MGPTPARNDLARTIVVAEVKEVEDLVDDVLMEAIQQVAMEVSTFIKKNREKKVTKSSMILCNIKKMWNQGVMTLGNKSKLKFTSKTKRRLARSSTVR